MTIFPVRLIAPTLACLVLGACDPAPKPGRAEAPAAPASTPVAPARPMKMVCKNSRNGLKVACGTPNAVMVGMAPA